MIRLPLWLRPWLWRPLYFAWRAGRARRRTLLEAQKERERRARRRMYGCDCGRIVRGSPGARRLRAFQVCPDLGCTKLVSRTTTA